MDVSIVDQESIATLADTFYECIISVQIFSLATYVSNRTGFGFAWILE